MSVYDAIVLAGGLGTRLGGLDKPSIDVAGRTMLERVLTACSNARTVVVVGTPRPTIRRVTWTVEDPPHGGPLAGLGAGLAALPPDAYYVVVLASDMPFLTADNIAHLMTELPGHDAAVFVDKTGMAQPLAGAYLTTTLWANVRAAGDLRGQPAMRILDDLNVALVADHGATRDCDTADQLEVARKALR